ncbi:hypothetical protein CU098_009468 [Rhizopus stolonifer]|uniref:Lipocalin-like domain-containing protein n=1 Tax=Rhizopus stolonifer TaxID=4846 RepID=A0A367K8I7_RHIST|nr:hypothetical protein CU098_009468 [Rhizopus stolonifer]
MKFFQLATAAVTFLTAFVGAQQNGTIDQGSNAFNMSAINGTWHVAGLTKSLLHDFDLLTEYYNFSIKCPQIYITGNSTNVSYIQPSFNLEWYNDTLKSNQTANVSFSGLMTLENVTSATQANFSVLMAIPSMNQSYSTNSLARMLAANSPYSSSSSSSKNFTAGNVTNPLPNGPDFSAIFSFNLTSSNGSVYDIALLTASNFTNLNETNQNSSLYRRQLAPSAPQNMTNQVYRVLLTNNTTPLNETAFNSTIQAYGDTATNVTWIQDTCNSTQSSSSSSSSTRSSSSRTRSASATQTSATYATLF